MPTEPIIEPQTEPPRTTPGRALVAWSESDARPLPEFGYETVADAVRAIETTAIRAGVSLRFTDDHQVCDEQREAAVSRGLRRRSGSGTGGERGRVAWPVLYASDSRLSHYSIPRRSPTMPRPLDPLDTSLFGDDRRIEATPLPFWMGSGLWKRPAMTDERQAGLREALIAYLRDTLEDTALLIDDHRAGKETDKRWGWFADGILAALAVAQVPAQPNHEVLLDAVRTYGDARADVAYGRATRKAIDLAWDHVLAAADIPPMDARVPVQEERLDELRVLSERATPGPWESDGTWVTGTSKVEHEARIIVAVNDAEDDDWEADRTFIVAAVNYVRRGLGEPT